MAKCCENCCFWKLLSHPMGQCRRFPPVFFPIGRPPNEEVDFQGYFPEVNAEMICGEYQLRTNP